MNERNKNASIAGTIGIIGNIFLFIMKIFIGLISHSEAMIADATNSGSDVLNSVLTVVGNKISSKDRDDDHNLGHGKAEYIYSMLISIIMILLAFQTIHNSILSIIKPEEYKFNIFLIIVCLINLFIKVLLFIITNKIGKKYKNILVEASAKDHLNDCFITLGTLFSVVMTYYHYNIIDGLVGAIIGLWIFYTGIKIFISSYDTLMDKTCPQEIKDKVLDIVNKHEEIDHITHFNATPVGYKYQVSFSIFVDGNLSTFKSHDIANNLEKEIDKKVEEIYLTVIHVNPIEKKNNMIK